MSPETICYIYTVYSDFRAPVEFRTLEEARDYGELFCGGKYSIDVSCVENEKEGM